MKNVMEIGGYKALIAFDPDTNQFRGEFVDLNGGADFYAVDVKSLQREGKLSLKVFSTCAVKTALRPAKAIRASSWCACQPCCMSVRLFRQRPKAKA